jgi:integrase
MSFLLDVQELKPGLIMFRRGDVKHQNWYCRVRVPKDDRYKTISLKTADVETARERAFDQDADLRFRIKHQVPIFNRPFSQLAKEYADFQKERYEAGQITKHRWETVVSVIDAQLNRYVGSVQINLVGQDRWDGYPLWRQKNGKGRNGRVSEATIRYEMTIFRSIMAFAARKKYIPDSHIFKGKLPLAKVRREEFTPEEYRKLHTFARGWIKKGPSSLALWYRTVAYNFLLIMCNTGMRPPEAKNLRWRDVSIRQDNQGRKFVVLHVRGKSKFRQLVAAGNVADYLERIREIAKGKQPDDFVFTTIKGTTATTLYAALIERLLKESELLFRSSGSRRSTYSFRHTYATFRLSEGVDVHFLARQMGTSVQIIEDHYSHVTPVKNADRILQGLPGWEPISSAPKIATEPERVHELTEAINAEKPNKKKTRASKSGRAAGKYASRSRRRPKA